jgi:arabinosyltransferase
VGDRAAGYSTPGQYIQVRAGGPDAKPGFFAVASPPARPAKGGDGASAGKAAAAPGTLELLIRSGAGGEAADALAAAPPGTSVDASPVQGGGFPIDRIPPAAVDTVLLFATGSGIAPVAALIESGDLQAGRRRDVRLYYGTANREATAFADRAAGEWAGTHGVRTIHVFSDERDEYVQDVFASEGGLADPARAAAVLCGQREMCDAVKELLAAEGVPAEAVLLNF